MPKLKADASRASLLSVPGWRKKGSSILCERTFEDFPAAMKFVNSVARLAEKVGHHPDIDIRWNRVHLILTTHDAGGLTEKDFDLARQIDRI